MFSGIIEANIIVAITFWKQNKQQVLSFWTMEQGMSMDKHWREREGARKLWLCLLLALLGSLATRKRLRQNWGRDSYSLHELGAAQIQLQVCMGLKDAEAQANSRDCEIGCELCGPAALIHTEGTSQLLVPSLCIVKQLPPPLLFLFSYLIISITGTSVFSWLWQS